MDNYEISMGLLGSIPGILFVVATLCVIGGNIYERWHRGR